MFILKRDEHNPILSPRNEYEWEAYGAFNWSPIEKSKKPSALYRAQSKTVMYDGIHRSQSTIGLAEAGDGKHYDTRSQFIVPQHEWEKYGCEDARVTKLGKNYYIFYTALSNYPFSKDGIKVAVAKTDEKFKIIEKHLVTPFNAKAMGLFPEKINGKFAALLTIKTDEPPAEICYVEFEKESDMWSPDFWNEWRKEADAHRLEIRRSDNDQVELGAPPIHTPKGWLVIYSHIQGYFHGQRTFGIEALLLDLKNPKKIIARTKGAFMIPEEYYEEVGHVERVIFPSGAAVKNNKLEIYYGSTDTYSCKAEVNLKKFLQALIGGKEMVIRAPQNPIISPRPGMNFETRGTLNPAAVDIGGKVHIFYRAVADNNTSTIGYATSKDGITIDHRANEPVYTPRVDFEKPGGCEDPRTTIIGDRVHMLYTAYDGSVPRVAGTSIKAQDIMDQKWKWTEPKLITLSSITNKDACILPKKINGKYMVIHRMDDMICADFVESLDFENEPVKSCIPILRGRPGMWDGAKVGLASPPLETKKGWLFFYHGVSTTTHYRVGVALLDLKDPTKVISRGVWPIFEPKEEYEKKGIVPGVVFPCGVVERAGTIFLYYGGADLVTGVATLKVKDVLDSLSL
ncbi:MAG: hypothetical protein V4697_00335 [Patescibacteria group bacterium]